MSELEKDIIMDILKTIPTVYLLEALGVESAEELMAEPSGEWMGEYTEEEARKDFPNINKWCSRGERREECSTQRR